MIVCRKTGEKDECLEMDGQNLQQDSMDENMESSCVLLVEKNAVPEGICGERRNQSEKGGF